MPSYDLNGKEIAAAVVGELVVVMPIYNESENIRRVTLEWAETFKKLGISYSMLLMDDGSKDNTFEILKELSLADPSVVAVRKPNSGHGLSCRFGYELASSSAVEWILQIDSDGQCDPSYFPEFWSKRDKADCVFGYRKQRDDGILRYITSKICWLGSSIICGMDLKDANVPYRLMRKQALREALPKIPSHFNIHNVALTFVLKKTKSIRWEYIDIRFLERQGGENSINLPRVISWGAAMLLELTQIKIRK